MSIVIEHYDSRFSLLRCFSFDLIRFCRWGWYSLVQSLVLCFCYCFYYYIFCSILSNCTNKRNSVLWWSDVLWLTHLAKSNIISSYCSLFLSNLCLQLPDQEFTILVCLVLLLLLLLLIILLLLLLYYTHRPGVVQLQSDLLAWINRYHHHKSPRTRTYRNCIKKS